MARFTAIHFDAETDIYYRVVCSAASADDVEQKVKQFLYEESLKAGDFKQSDELDLSTFGETLCVFAGDHPNLITPDTEVESLVIPESWEPQDETPTE